MEIVLLILCVSIIIDWISYLIKENGQSLIYSVLVSCAITFVLFYMIGRF